ncbi:hypothetical protein [Nonomuraea cavernae]|uniref:hypothetical protein n=1 Tax=Nonomuraea cavernae TaxID=2045107 RepID=UPI003407CB22
MTYGTPGGRQAKSSPTIILLCSGLAAALGFLAWLVVGMTSTDESVARAPLPSVAATTGGTLPTPGGTAGGTPAALRTQPRAEPGDDWSVHMLIVGEDIEPGTYTSRSRDGNPMVSCFWARFSSTAGLPADEIESNKVTGPVTVTIQPTDRGFATGGCEEWVKVRSS